MINDKIGKLMSELQIIIAKTSRVYFDLSSLRGEIEAEKAIENCRLRRLAILEETEDCGTDENGRCLGYSNSDGGEPCDECQECEYSVHYGEE